MERPAAPAASLTHHEKAFRLRDMFEVTEAEANGVLDACGGNLEQAISVLSASNASSSEGGVIAQETGNVTPQPGPAVDKATGSVNDPIDLTREDDALQRALALSIQDMQQQPQGVGAQGGGASGISLEDQELSRALEASIAENQASLARLGLPLFSVFVDPLNPHERCRAGHTSVGLKNIGNTCWFSAVIQSLFHIPVFRKLILSYGPPALPNGVTEFPQCVRFVLELQRLFALLLGSERKYINPQATIQALREAFAQGPPVHGLQQDVSEVTHKLLEWIEDAFKMAAVPSDGEEGEAGGNPIVQLFNGHCRSQGVLDDTPFVNESGFGALPVQVRGHAHIHDSIEAATCNPEMQQEMWFTHLPCILVLELSRFQFNQRIGQAEKIHDRLPFDRVLFMDRYLEAMKVESRRRRLEVARLKATLRQLLARLSSYTHYQRKPVSITEVLGLTLQFIHSEGKDPAPGSDVRVPTLWKDPTSSSEGMDNPAGSTPGQSLTDCAPSFQAGQEPLAEEEDTLDSDCEGSRGKRPRTSLHPAPRFVSERETETLDACLSRWTHEVEQDIAELREGVAATQQSLDAVYSDSAMCSTCYQLHAVLVHQGQASGGHYWAYVRKRPAWEAGGQKQSQTTNQQSQTTSGDHSHHITVENDDLGVDTQCGSDTKSHDSSHDSGAGSGDVVLESQSESEEIEVTEVSENIETAQKGRTDFATDSHTGQLSAADRRPCVVTEPSEPSQTTFQTSQAGSASSRDGELWLKFNDVSVMEVGWEEVVRESYGGQQNTSAYCLLYISQTAEEQWAGQVSQFTLSPELQRCVAEDNTSFRAEIAAYDTRREKVAAAKHIHWEDRDTADKAGSPVSDGAAYAADARAVGPKHDLSPEHMQVDPSVHMDPLSLPPVDPLLITELKAKLEYKHQYLAIKEGQGLLEPRLSHVGSYAIRCSAPEPLVRALVLHEVAAEAAANKREEIQLLAKREFVATLSQPRVQDDLNLLRTCYQLFCAVCYHCVQAVKAAREERWEEVMIHAVHAFSLNGDVVRQASRDYALPPRWISWLRRKALKGLSSKAFQQFENGKVSEALQLANSHLIPALKAFSLWPCEGDNLVLEAVREEWCQCLVHPLLNEAEQDQLADILTRMFEDYSKASALPTPSTPEEFHPPTLALEFSNAMRHMTEETATSDMASKHVC